jgi:hypothetical protein
LIFGGFQQFIRVKAVAFANFNRLELDNLRHQPIRPWISHIALFDPPSS